MAKTLPWSRRALHGLIQIVTDFVAHIPSQHLRRWGLRVGGMRFGEHSVIYGGAEIRYPWKIMIGRYSSVGTRATLDGRGGLKIGDRVNISSEVMIWTVQHDYRAADFAAYAKPVVVEDYAWLGPRVIVLPGVVIAEGCIVAAGAVVTRSTEPYGMYAGVPARRIGERPRDLHYAPGENYTPFV